MYKMDLDLSESVNLNVNVSKVNSYNKTEVSNDTSVLSSNYDEVPWDVDESENNENKDLEIYKMSERFKSLNLLSGNNFNDTELERYIRDNYGKEGLMRFTLAKFVINKLGFRPSKDVLLMLSCTKKAKAIIATAGSGKTTSLQLDLVISKMLSKISKDDILAPKLIEGTDVSVPGILYLNYNKHNVKPISERHKSICFAINSAIEKNEAICDDIDSSTVHSFCHRWLSSFSNVIDIPDLKIITEENKMNIWEAIKNPRWKKFYGDDVACTVSYEELDELYMFKTESMLDWDDFFLTAKFIDSGLNSEFVKSCLKKYDSMKKQMNLIDFTDYLVLMIDVLRKYPDLKSRLQERYKIIVADENQDFTRLMNELLIELYNPEKNKLIIVGDPDQTIYAFRGVSPVNIVYMVEKLPDVEVLGLDTNYRCPENIVNGAKEILKLNVLRFEKPIGTIKTGGKIINHPISLEDSQDSLVINLLSSIPKEEWCNTVITYRNNSSSLTVSEELYYNNIPFVILDGSRPFSNWVFQHILKALKALKQKDDMELNKTLYRFTPISKDVWYEIIAFNHNNRRNHLHDLAVPNDLPRGSSEALGSIIRISEIIGTNPVSDYISILFDLYKKYYFKFIVQSNSQSLYNKSTDEYLLYYDRAFKFFNRPMSFDYILLELQERNKDNISGVTLSTFHGLKGLEFNYVIAIDFVESLFPNYYSIEQRYSINTAMQEKEAENRLCYVLVTRAVKELHLFYYNNDPSLYVSLLNKSVNSEKFSDVGKENISLGSVTNLDANNSKLLFVQKLMSGRG